ncbi:HIT-like protein [Aspergillus piperis CBS 112811]|uniref:HIT-like protein n=1 Tax=Aspergillus piperis CBS 112811 TaxID=1448313 RepID=A0A8G1R388_9EURO|nr:HIT-like protein [Aspergillus piperis CBS 112811]RAH58352.1 HIT-like protein [Aspergillus piperis CBS 112811]
MSLVTATHHTQNQTIHQNHHHHHHTNNNTMTTEIHRTNDLTISLSHTPTTPGHTLATLTTTTTLFSLPKSTFTTTLLTLRTITPILKQTYNTPRIALITSGNKTISLLPLHGLPSPNTWTPILSPETTFHDPQTTTSQPNYITSKSGPRMPSAQLTHLANTITTHTLSTANYTFHGPSTDTNLFANIIRGTEHPQWRIWEDESHVAFLTPYPNTPGFTVVVPRRHLGSDIFALGEEEYKGLVGAAWTVGRVLMEALGVGRCGMVFEGFEVDYAHVKLVPVYGEDEGGGEREVFREVYPGYVSSLPGPEVEDVEELVRRAGEIRGVIAARGV